MKLIYIHSIQTTFFSIFLMLFFFSYSPIYSQARVDTLYTDSGKVEVYYFKNDKIVAYKLYAKTGFFYARAYAPDGRQIFQGNINLLHNETVWFSFYPSGNLYSTHETHEEMYKDIKFTKTVVHIYSEAGAVISSGRYPLYANPILDKQSKSEKQSESECYHSSRSVSRS